LLIYWFNNGKVPFKSPSKLSNRQKSAILSILAGLAVQIKNPAEGRVPFII